MSEKADELAGIALELITRIRDEDPDAVHRWLASVVEPADWMGLSIVLACAVPDDQPWTALTAWTYRYEPNGPDTPDAIAYRRAVLDEALHGRKAA